MAEIGADQLAARRREIPVLEPERRFELGVALLEHGLGLPVPLLEVVQHPAIFLAHAAFTQRGDVLDQVHRPVAMRVGRLPAKVERAQHDPRRVGVQPGIKYVQVAVGRP